MIAAYVGLGLPLTALGVAWPSMRHDLGRPLPDLGVVIVTFTVGYLLATTSYGRTGSRVGTGPLLVVASALAALAAVGIAATREWWLLLAASAVLGVSGGIVDAALNSHVALHRSGRTMHLMHGGFGVGATLGPLVMTALIGADLSWRWAYVGIAALQVVLAAGFAWTLAAWPGPAPARTSAATRDPAVAEPAPPHHARAAAWLGPAVFLAYGAVEVAVGAWAYELLTHRGLSPGVAGASVTAYWGALALGRLLLGGPGHRIPLGRVVAGSVALTTAATLGFWLLPSGVSVVALVGIGFGLAGIFPALTALTPERVGVVRAPSVIGAQLAAAVVGGAIGSALVGAAAGRLGTGAIAPALAVAAVVLLVTDLALMVWC
jgi:fucose permease